MVQQAPRATADCITQLPSRTCARLHDEGSQQTTVRNEMSMASTCRLRRTLISAWNLSAGRASAWKASTGANARRQLRSNSWPMSLPAASFNRDRSAAARGGHPPAVWEESNGFHTECISKIMMQVFGKPGIGATSTHSTFHSANFNTASTRPPPSVLCSSVSGRGRCAWYSSLSSAALTWPVPSMNVVQPWQGRPSFTYQS